MDTAGNSELLKFSIYSQNELSDGPKQIVG